MTRPRKPTRSQSRVLTQLFTPIPLSVAAQQAAERAELEALGGVPPESVDAIVGEGAE